MTTYSEISGSGFVPVLSISPLADDHLTLQHVLRRQDRILAANRTLTIRFCDTLAAALAALAERQFAVVVCERDLQPGSWKDVLDQVTILPDPPPLIVTSRLADERLWAEALNLGAYDVLAKPFDRTEATRVVGAAWRTWGSPTRFPARRERYKWKVAAAAQAS